MCVCGGGRGGGDVCACGRGMYVCMCGGEEAGQHAGERGCRGGGGEKGGGTRACNMCMCLCGWGGGHVGVCACGFAPLNLGTHLASRERVACLGGIMVEVIGAPLLYARRHGSVAPARGQGHQGQQEQARVVQHSMEGPGAAGAAAAQCVGGAATATAILPAAGWALLAGRLWGRRAWGPCWGGGRRGHHGMSYMHARRV